MIQVILQRNTSNVSEDTFQSLKRWIAEHIHRPIQGFEHKKNPDGTEFTKAQQLSATRFQAINVVNYFLSRGKSYDEILNVLKIFK